MIASKTIKASNMVDKTITATQIANDTITATQIAPNAVGASELANNAVDTSAIQNGVVTDSKVASVVATKVVGLATVAKTGSYNDLSNKPTMPTNIAPLPINGTINNTPVGCWLGIYENITSYVYYLPSGGTWAWYLTHQQNSVFFVRGGVSSGGSNVLPSGSTGRVWGFIWRIQ